MKTILTTLAGSRGYGLHTPASDFDYRSVGLSETALWPETTRRTSNPPYDDTTYELGHFMRLAAQANPNVLEVLWCPVEDCTPTGSLLLYHRDLFLSQRVLKTYGGYAVCQLGRTLKSHNHKDAMHLARLVLMGRQILETGRLNIVPPQRDWLMAIRNGDYHETELREWAAEDLKTWASIASPLPVEPSTSKLEQLYHELTH